MTHNKSEILRTIKVIFKSQEPLTTKEIIKETGLCRRTIQRHTKALIKAQFININYSSEKRVYEYYRAF